MGVVAITDDGDGLIIEERLSLADKRELTYQSTVTDRGGVFPYCAVLRLERKTKRGWRPARVDWARSRNCFRKPSDVPSATKKRSSWEMTMVVHGRLRHLLDVRRARAHGFTSLGGGVTLPRGGRGRS